MNLVREVGYKVGGQLHFNSILLAVGQKSRRERLLQLLFSRWPDSVVDVIAHKVDQRHCLRLKVLVEKVVTFGVHDHHR